LGQIHPWLTDKKFCLGREDRAPTSYLVLFGGELTMANSPAPKPRNPNNLSPEKYARLRAEMAAPYRGLRKFIYVTCGASGGIGAFVFLAKVLAGRDLGTSVPNLAFQVGIVALMVWLFKIDRARS